MTARSHSRLATVEQALETHREVLRRRIRSRMGPHIRRVADSEDFADSALREVLERSEDPASPKIENLPAWVWKAALSKLQDAGRRLALARGEEESAHIDDLSSREPSPSSQAQLAETSEILSHLLVELKPDDEVAIRHYYILGLRGESLGESLGVSASAAAHRVERALRRLRALSEDRDEF